VKVQGTRIELRPGGESLTLVVREDIDSVVEAVEQIVFYGGKHVALHNPDDTPCIITARGAKDVVAMWPTTLEIRDPRILRAATVPGDERPN
jgi:hypothetical protein